MRRLLLLILLPLGLSSQSVYLPATHPVYRFLDKMEAKQTITGYRDAVKPLSRAMIARLLVQLDSASARLTAVEQDERMFYLEEFREEAVAAGFHGHNDGRWDLYRYTTDAGSFVFNPILGYSRNNRADGRETSILSNGLQTFGTVGGSIGLSMTFRDNLEYGSYQQASKPLSMDQANVIVRTPPSKIQYNIVQAQVSLLINGITLSIEKQHNAWGAGEYGKLILSDKAPSFPQIKLQIPFGKDVDFTYIHGWLYSDMIDSVRSYQVNGIPGSVGYRRLFVQKYIAAHILEFTPFTGVDIAMGESQVYGGRNPEVLFLIPMMFFKAAEHWMKDTDNSQLFMSVDLNLFPGHNYYGTLFIDEVVTEEITNPAKHRNQVGFTLGARWYDLLMNDMRIDVEYTRVNPWVYNHKFPDATYQSHSINMGHWIGQNADLLTVGVMFRPFRSLEAGLRFESLRKGGKDSTALQYKLPTPEFLYGPLTKRQTVGLVGTYEPVRDLMVDFHLLRSRFSSAVTRTSFSYVNNPNEYVLGKGYSKEWDVFIGLRYNFD